MQLYYICPKCGDSSSDTKDDAAEHCLLDLEQYFICHTCRKEHLNAKDARFCCDIKSKLDYERDWAW